MSEISLHETSPRTGEVSLPQEGEVNQHSYPLDVTVRTDTKTKAFEEAWCQFVLNLVQNKRIKQNEAV